MRPEVEAILKDTRAFLCLDCGKCTGSCPIARIGISYSPRLHIARTVYGYENETMADLDLWACLTCGLCEVNCPSAVRFVSFIEKMRAVSAKERRGGICAHAGITQLLAKSMASDGHKQDRLGWVTDDLGTSEKGDVLYFVGCLPYFDTIFENIGIEGTKIAKNTVGLLNKLGVSPIVMKDEVCCGHDLLWAGDLANFEKLARRNAELISRSGAKTIVTSCAECVRTLKIDYPRFAKLGCEVKHISEFAAERLGVSPVAMRKLDQTVSYQVPCRLGRHLKIYDPPRQVLAKIPGINLVEMSSNREFATCCGTTHFLNCTNVSEGIRRERFAEAMAVGVDTIVTACPKCQIHLKCSQSNRMNSDGVNRLRVTDFATVVNEHMSAE